MLVHPTVQQIKQTNATYAETDLIKADSHGERSNREAAHAIKLNSSDWDKTLEKLAALFDGGHFAALSASPVRRTRPVPQAEASVGTLTHPKYTPLTHMKTGILSPLQESETHYFATAVIAAGNDHLKLATVSWLKEQLQSWLASAEPQVRSAISPSTFAYTLPSMSDAVDACTDDTWRTSLALNLPDARDSHTAVWTGSEMIIWGGGFGYPFTPFNTGGRYNPGTNSWIATTTTNAPAARDFHTAVWTGSEMIVWGGEQENFQQLLNTGGRYRPATNTWTALSTANAASARAIHTAVWTGSAMIIWGGTNNDVFELNTGARYRPQTDSWTSTSTTNAPTARYDHTAVWTGSQMIVWGGQTPTGRVNNGGRYNPGTNTWMGISTTNAPALRALHTAVWTGTEMIVWGGDGNFSHSGVLNSGGRYNPASNTWTRDNPPIARIYHTAVWTGNEMIVWGGLYANLSLNTGGRYRPSTDVWTSTNTARAPSGRFSHSAVWTGNEMIVWGGIGDLGTYNTGGKYNPSTNTWTATSVTGAPFERAGHSVVWTGAEMIVWGGNDSRRTGGRYNPSTNSWRSTSITNAPIARSGHTAVWTGTEMIIWGGSWEGEPLNTGGKYNPITNAWAATTITNAPVSRWRHTAVWTGTEMIIWGGNSADLTECFNTGGKYNPTINSWTATSITRAPSARSVHTAIWTGSEMIAWGGYDNIHPWLDTGGRYNPNTDRWRPTSTNNAPAGRLLHTAVWANDKMIVWSGLTRYGTSDSGGIYCAQ